MFSNYALYGRYSTLNFNQGIVHLINVLYRHYVSVSHLSLLTQLSNLSLVLFDHTFSHVKLCIVAIDSALNHRYSVLSFSYGTMHL